MAVDQVWQETYLEKIEKEYKKFLKKISWNVYLKSNSYQVNSFIIQVVFQRLLELPDHRLHKLASEVVVAGVQEAN